MIPAWLNTILGVKSKKKLCEDIEPPWISSPDLRPCDLGRPITTQYDYWRLHFDTFDDEQRRNYFERWHPPAEWAEYLFKVHCDLVTFMAHFNNAQFCDDDFLLFWGHTPTAEKITKSCFSQWYEATCTIDGIAYRTAEHFLMAEKARLFKDDENLLKIINSTSPAEAKSFGRKIKNFDDAVWCKNRFHIALKANYEKFSQHPELKEFLLATEERILVEASPVDTIWGIGLAQDHPDAKNPVKWHGLNLLGFVLMKVREDLSW